MNYNCSSKSSIVWMRTATLKQYFEFPAGMLLLFVILGQILGAISPVSPIVAICVGFFKILSLSTSSQSLLRTNICIWTKLIFLYAFIMSADLACNITLKCLVNPTVYQHTCTATLNVASVMLFIML